MTVYETAGPDASGLYLIGYPTPGVPHVFTAAGAAPSKRIAEEACSALNEAQVAHLRASLVRTANMLADDLRGLRRGVRL